MNDVLLAPQDENHFYSRGLDTVYVNGERHFLVLWNTSSTMADPPPAGNYIVLSLYSSDGDFVTDLATYADPLNEDGASENDVIMWPQSVKLDPSESTVWISYTNNEGGYGQQNVSDWFCTLPWDPTLTSYPVAMTPEFQLGGNWEMEWSTDPNTAQNGQRGRPFVSGLIAPWHNGIYVYTGGSLQAVVDTGGSSAGFAFDRQGNLWYATYFGSPETIYVWTAAQIHNAVTQQQVLTTTDATHAFLTPENCGGNDVERDGAGNLYFSLNLGSTGYGKIVVAKNTGQASWPTSTTILTETVEQYDWQRALAVDGSGDLSLGQGLLFVDMEQGTKGVTLPTLVEISSPAPHSVPAVSPSLLRLLMVPLSLLGAGALYKKKDIY